MFTVLHDRQVVIIVASQVKQVLSQITVQVLEVESKLYPSIHEVQFLSDVEQVWQNLLQAEHTLILSTK